MAEKSAPSCHPTLRQQDQRSWPAPCAIQIPAADLISPIRPSSSRARKKEKGGWGRCEPPLRRSGRRRGQKAAGGGASESAKKRGVRELEAEKPAASSARRAGGTVAARRPPTTVRRCHTQQGEVGALLLDGIPSALTVRRCTISAQMPNTMGWAPFPHEEFSQ